MTVGQIIRPREIAPTVVLAFERQPQPWWRFRRPAKVIPLTRDEGLPGAWIETIVRHGVVVHRAVRAGWPMYNPSAAIEVDPGFPARTQRSGIAVMVHTQVEAGADRAPLWQQWPIIAALAIIAIPEAIYWPLWWILPDGVGSSLAVSIIFGLMVFIVAVARRNRRVEAAKAMLGIDRPAIVTTYQLWAYLQRKERQQEVERDGREPDQA